MTGPVREKSAREAEAAGPLIGSASELAEHTVLRHILIDSGPSCLNHDSADLIATVEVGLQTGKKLFGFGLTGGDVEGKE